MASRLYPATRSLFRQVLLQLTVLGVVALLSPTQCQLIALYITGLILLDKRQNAKRITRWLPARCHDAINRLLRVVPFSIRMLMLLLVAFAQSLGCAGYLCLDDVVVEKRFAKKIPWVGWAYSTSAGRPVRGLHIVVLLWCCSPFKIPVAFRLWRPKERCRPGRYRTKHQLAQAMIIEMLTVGLPFTYLTFDIWYNARWLTKFLDHCGVIWVSQLKCNANVVYRNRKMRVDALAQTLKLKWRPHLGLRAIALLVYLPEYGVVRLVVTRDGHGRWEYLVTNELQADLTRLVVRKRSRWNIEQLFRGAKQLAGLAACQCYVDQAMVRHVALVMVSYVVLQLLRTDPSETVDGVKERWQLQVLTGGMTPPEPLRARTM